MDKIIKNLDTIFARAHESCARVGRLIDSFEIVPATKTRDRNAIMALAQDGRIKTCGENRVQEFISKYTSMIEWDMIGQLQTNKVKYIIDKIRLIQSVDRVELLEEINKRAGAINKVQKVLLEINTGAEDSKGGVKFNDIHCLALKTTEYKNIELSGIMAVAPFNIDKNSLRKLFMKTNDVFIQLKQGFNTVKYLSMGMSEDFEIALECGANIIRPGRIIFE
ncbi:MAG: YggS family pyridoxal phosphate-dependent enzyme [Christensenellaceae bacterium]|nr:YggS family pyridoxal phosphate-dependent enzyme [Christensenellaceae bacterium]